MDPTGRHVTKSPDTTGGDVGPTWSPSGTRIAFVRADPFGDQELFAINTNGTGLRRLTSNRVDDSQPAWSPAGDAIAFVRTTADGHSAVY